jgi:hypothetical protein
VKTADASEKIDELVGGLFGHALPKHMTIKFGSHKWTPVHPGGDFARPPLLASSYDSKGLSKVSQPAEIKRAYVSSRSG